MGRTGTIPRLATHLTSVVDAFTGQAQHWSAHAAQIIVQPTSSVGRLSVSSALSATSCRGSTRSGSAYLRPTLPVRFSQPSHHTSVTGIYIYHITMGEALLPWSTVLLAFFVSASTYPGLAQTRHSRLSCVRSARAAYTSARSDLVRLAGFVLRSRLDAIQHRQFIASLIFY